MENTFLVNAQGISVQFNDRKVLQNVDLRVNKGRIVTLIGPNGAGKTTLVRIVLGLLTPHAGKVELKKDLRVGYMPQKLAIDMTMPMTVKRFLQLAPGASQSALEKALTEVKIGHLENQQINSVSGGELQRVLLARALIPAPHLLVLDEPAQGVDVAGQAELYELINQIRQEHDCGVLMISHDLHLVMSATDEVVCLNHHICCHGEPEHVSNDPSYLELFGKKGAENLAIYTHNHNHEHDIHGDIIEQDRG